MSKKKYEDRVRVFGVGELRQDSVAKSIRDRIKFGTEGYHQLYKPLLIEIHEAYAGRVTFFWLNGNPYVEDEQFDWFVAGRAFGCLLRKEHGGTGAWQDMQLGWLDDAHRAYEEYGFCRELELDNGAVMPIRYVQNMMHICQGFRL